ncbi:MAG TPA: hypothetical protein VN752_12050 [Solirubrobacterales bacterium]|nr:hypothetical protein [Solirubrobacterales bacterium]
MSSRARKRTTAAAAIAIGGLLLLLAAPGMGESSVSCAYVEAGAPGAAGNVLRIEDGTNTVTHIYREGEDIIVFNNASDRVPCTGDAATIFNTDRIEYVSTNGVPFFGYIGNEALTPGATPEPSGSEIEIVVQESFPAEVLNVAGTSGSETIVAGQLGRRRLGVNLNAQADGAKQDADVILDDVDPSWAFVRVAGRGGADRLSALGGPGFSGSLLVDRLQFSGGPGDDLLAGGPGSDLLSGGDGDDVMRSGRGRDHISVGPGSDLVKAGKGADRVENHSDVGGTPPDLGPDRVFTGAGNDYVNLERSPRGNLLRCGTGRRDSAVVNLDDRVAECERVEVTRR